jgi:membrane-bound lytic murein transglycosylase MltF
MRSRAIGLGLSCLIVAAPTAPGADFLEVKERGKLRVLRLADPDSAGIVIEDGERPGFDHEVLQGFAMLHQVRLEAIEVDGWELLAAALQAGLGDLVAGPLDPSGRQGDLILVTTDVLPGSLGPSEPPPLRASEKLAPPGQVPPASDPVESPHTLVYGLRRADQELLTALRDYLLNLQHTSTWRDLVTKYYPETTRAEHVRAE